MKSLGEEFLHCVLINPHTIEQNIPKGADEGSASATADSVSLADSLKFYVLQHLPVDWEAQRQVHMCWSPRKSCLTLINSCPERQRTATNIFLTDSRFQEEQRQVSRPRTREEKRAELGCPPQPVRQAPHRRPDHV